MHKKRIKYWFDLPKDEYLIMETHSNLKETRIWGTKILTKFAQIFLFVYPPSKPWIKLLISIIFQQMLLLDERLKKTPKMPFWGIIQIWYLFINKYWQLDSLSQAPRRRAVEMMVRVLPQARNVNHFKNFEEKLCSFFIKH